MALAIRAVTSNSGLAANNKPQLVPTVYGRNQLI